MWDLWSKPGIGGRAPDHVATVSTVVVLSVSAERATKPSPIGSCRSKANPAFGSTQATAHCRSRQTGLPARCDDVALIRASEAGYERLKRTETAVGPFGVRRVLAR